MPLSLDVIVKLLRTRRIPFLGLTGTGLDDLDGLLIAGALTRLSKLLPVSSEETSLDLTQIAFGPGVRDRINVAGVRAGVCVYLSSPKGPALRGR